MTRTRATVAVAMALTILGAAPAARATPTTLLRSGGIGPLTLGMTRTAAVGTGWLGHRGRGCELSSPRPVTYRFSGPKAPAGLRGTAQFDGGRLRNLSFTRGVRTAAGVHIGTTPGRMVTRYRALGFSATAQYVSTFQGTFVDVKRGGHQIVGAFAAGSRITILAAPRVAVCE